jgi:hypothetical protein
MKSIAIISCDHGLGHIRRSYLLGLELTRRGATVTMFAPKHKFLKISNLFGETKGLHNTDFATHTTTRGLCTGDLKATRWELRVPALDPYDVVISDNLPEVLAIRPDALISAQFFWHDVLPHVTQDYRMRARSLLDHHRPPIIATSLFATNKVRNNMRYIPVGLYVSKSKSEPRTNQTDLLITGGSTPILKQKLKPILDMFLENSPEPFQKIHVDPSIFPVTHPPWIKKADYSSKMYANTIAAICRPGLGCLTDLLCHGGRPFCIFETENLEMIYNAQVLKKNHLGETLQGSLFSDYAKVERYASNPADRINHVNRTNLISFNGAGEAASYIEKHVAR